jgi:hypothetical protein
MGLTKKDEVNGKHLVISGNIYFIQFIDLQSLEGDLM